MKINKNQALYKALPHCWTTYSDFSVSDYKYACEVIAWNTKEVYGINEDIIRSDILRRINSFKNSGGKVDNSLFESMGESKFVECAQNNDIPDIICVVNPKTFYCQTCNTVTYRPKATQAPSCIICNNKRTSQLQMVYACECGYVDGVKPPIKGKLTYHSKEKENQFKFFNQYGGKVEMKISCPVCNKTLYPKNALDSRLFFSQSGSLVNLYNEKYAEILKKYGRNAELLIIAKWFSILDEVKFRKILENPKPFFEKDYLNIDLKQVELQAQATNKTIEEIIKIIIYSDRDDIENLKNQIRKKLPLESLDEEKLKLLTLDLMEYDTLKNPKGQISLKEAVLKNIETGTLIEEEEITRLLNVLHIREMQVSEQVQIVNYAYGYTRLRSCPDGTISTNNLMLRGFDNNIFTTILDTEGILVEIDMIYVYYWLIDNNIVSGDEDIETLDDAKSWFIENINLDGISHFSEISGSNNKITKVVYSLLHTISHMMIKSAGKHSGLSRDSISEIIFPNTCSFFIYPTSSEGVTLGSLSGMFETGLYLFLDDALKDNEICTFDPLCSENQNGACVACAYLSEVNCNHFNIDLSRSYLYGGTINKNDEKIVIKKGFWK